MYLYGCSLGAICGTLYLINDAENTPIKAAAFYGTPMSVHENQEFFGKSLYGLYNYIFGASFVG